MRKNILGVLTALLCGIVLAPPVFACACCAEAGTYSISTVRPGEFEFDILHEMQFDQSANLYMTEAGFEVIRGLDVIKTEFETAVSPASREFDLAASFSDAAKWWRFHFTSNGRKTGNFVLPIPRQMVSFKVDTHEGDVDGLGPILYKEWRFKGTIQKAEGFVRAGIVNPTEYFLVFQGRGNKCDDVSDFTHWRLEINGRRARYAFYGVLGSGRKLTETQEPAKASALTPPQ